MINNFFHCMICSPLNPFQDMDAREKVHGLLAFPEPKDVSNRAESPNKRLSTGELYKKPTISLLKRPNLSAFGVHTNSETDYHLESQNSD
jgi:hypothetical protein